ncbi:hypothetical protein OCB09_00740 [Bacillus cereus]|nr:hypothetical protein [Bacillus cereus]
MIRIAIGIKEKNKTYIPVGIYMDGSVKELTMSDLTEKECDHYNELLKSMHRNIFHYKEMIVYTNPNNIKREE